MLEVRDKGTFIPVMAVRLLHELDDPDENDQAAWMLRKCGFGDIPSDFVVVFRMDIHPIKGMWSPYEWTGASRTMPTAHDYIMGNFHKLKDGDVVDVEWILGETDHPKQSDRFWIPEEN